MGLTLEETVIFVLGAVLIARFLVRAGLPQAHTRFVSAANRHSEELREEFVFLPPARIAAVLLVSATLLAGAALAATRSVAVAAIFGAAPVLFAGLLVRWYRNRRKRSILLQLPSLLDLLSGHVRAGHSLSESLAETVPLLPAGIREEMAWVLQQNRLGTALPEALVHWEERIRSEETSLLVRPLRAAIPGGGNVVDLLERTRDILRLRIRTTEKLRSMTAQARLQALVLTLLPPAFLVTLSKVDPGFFPNLLGTPQGKTILAIAVTLQVLGWVTIRKILSVRP
ncbi:MAG: pilus assembly protein [Deltaproteobacteria bacterium]|nr:pilus assembly protein [Deltaproteobacteria bacterium]MBS1244721.1 pilus assembly protein [Deltaproteobacteria bacterium]